MATVLLSAIAATIALVLVRQTVLVARAESVRSDFDTAYQAALGVKIDFEHELSADPQFFYKRLYKYERPRMCLRTASAPLAVVPPEDPASVNDADANAPHDTSWPANCPTSWTYLPTGQQAIGTDDAGNTIGYDPAQHPVRLELTPPSPGHPTLSVRILADQGQTETGLTATYRPSSATSITAYSQTDLRLDAIDATDPAAAGAAAADVSVRGALYAGGQLYLPTSGADFTGAQLFSENGFVGTIPDTGRFYTTTAAGAGTGGDTPVRDIRQVVPSPLSLDGLRGSYARLEQVGCPANSTPSLTTVDAVSYATTLCLRYGASVLTTAGATVVDSTTGTSAASGGARPSAYLLLFAGTVSNPTVKVYTAATPPVSPGQCLIQCDLTALATPDFAAGHHPASAPAQTRSAGPSAPLWQPLGELPLPAGGVVVTDADTYIGQCPASIAGSSAQCNQSTAARSVTVVAGSPRDPHDIVVAGPVAGTTATASAPAAQVGLVATGSVVVPFYARPSGADLTVHANIAAFGYGLKAGQSALRALPATQGPWAANPRNFGGSFTLVGSVAAPSLETALPGWAHVNVVADPDSVASPPPYFPGFSNDWVGQGTDRLSSYAVCGLGNCSAVW